MAVRIDESWDHRFSAQVNALGTRACQSPDIRIGTGCQKSAARERYSLGMRIGGIHGVDITVPENKLRLNGPRMRQRTGA
jgi:hypothetical protein